MRGGRSPGWWRIAELMAESLTQPPIDCAQADAAVREVVVRSRQFAWGAAGVAAARRTWADSTTARWVRLLSGTCQTGVGLVSDTGLTPVGPAALADRIRFYARCVCVAAITVLILLPLGTSSGRGFQAIVPIAAAATALAVDRAAADLARAWRDRRA